MKSINYLNKSLSVLIILLFICTGAQSNQCRFKKNIKIELVTSKGKMILILYPETRLHRENFIKLVKNNFYEGILFHRVINGFMAQTGDPNTRDPNLKVEPEIKNEGETIPAEFISNFHHKKGALAAARTGDNVNPQKASSGSQFYIVQGTVYSEEQLNRMENQSGIKFSEQAKKDYTSIGGTPFLDGNYTVFGEVVEGIEIIDKICSSSTKSGDVPVEDIKIISIRKKRRCSCRR